MLTGARQHVANYPGVTVEKKTGFLIWAKLVWNWSICRVRIA